MPVIHYVAADMLTVGFQSLYKYNTHDKQAQWGL